MKNDQLIDAIGKLDDTLFSEIEASMQTERTVVRDATFESQGASKPRFRTRRFVLVALAAVMLIGGAAALSAGSLGGFLKIGKTGTGGEEQKTAEYVPFEDVRINPSLITGSILDALKDIPERVRNYQLHDSIMPNALLKGFDTLDDALDYVGYANMIFPRLDYECAGVYTEGYGVSAAELDESVREAAGLDSEEYVLSDVSIVLTQKYHSNPDYYFSTFACLCTNYVKDDPVRIRMILDNAATATDQKTVNGRTFSILHTNDPDHSEGYRLATDVFWQENDIIFFFHIVYNEDCRDDAERVADEWMHSFP